MRRVLLATSIGLPQPYPETVRLKCAIAAIPTKIRRPTTDCSKVDSWIGAPGVESFGTFRAWPVYKYSVGHSVYGDKDRQGLGRALLVRLIAAATVQHYHVMIGGIDATNTGHRMGSSMTFKTLLGVDVPLIQAPMAGSQLSAMAIAVSNAGALGSLPAAMLSATSLRDELQKIRGGTQRPFNVNFLCHVAPPPSEDRLALWYAALAPYYRELGVATNLRPPPSRAPFSAESANVLEVFKPPIVSFHFGLPEPALLARIKSWGTKILSSATTVDEARWLEARGVDAIIAQGLEAGGHRGMFLSQDITTQSGTFALLPQIVRSVRVPVIAAGGIADTSSVAAAKALGAAGVQVGTAFLLCPEAMTSVVYRSVLSSEQVRHTALTNLFSGRPARGIVNRLMRELGPMSAAAPPFPLASAAIMPLREQAERNGSGDFSPLWAGQNASGCRAVPAAQIVRELMALT